MLNKLTFLFLLLKITGFAQVPVVESQPAVKFGVISPNEFTTTVEGADSAAAAIKIFDIGKGSFRYSSVSNKFSYIFERHVRYKVVNKNAYQLADLGIFLYNDQEESGEKLESISGATYNLEDKKIITSKMDDNDRFSKRHDKNYTLKNFTLPNVKEGSIIEYTYKTKSDFIYRLNDWEFQGPYPCLYSSFTIIVPWYFSYHILKSGYLDISQSKAVQVKHPVSDVATRLQFSLNKIPSIKEESHITTVRDYLSKIGFELHSIQYPNQPLKEFSSTWPKIIAQLKSNEKFGNYLHYNKYDKKLLANILGAETDPERKISLVFDFVKNTIKWNGEYNSFTDAEATNQKKVLEKHSGNSAEINLLLISMLKDAGIKAYPMLISTRGHGTHPGYPVLSKFNSLIVFAETNQKKHLLDAINKNHADGLISVQHLNHKGLKIDLSTDSVHWLDLDFPEQTTISHNYILNLDRTNTFKGQYFISSDNYAALERRNTYQSAPTQKEYISDLQREKTGLQIIDYEVHHIDNPEQVLTEKMSIKIEDQVDTSGNLIYFTPMMFDRIKENPFKMEQRNFPVDFAYPREDNFRITVEYPKNYKLEKLPQSARYRLDNDAGSFTIIYSADNNGLMISSKIIISKVVFSSGEYFDLKELYKNIVQKQAEQIVLRRVPE